MTLKLGSVFLVLGLAGHASAFTTGGGEFQLKQSLDEASDLAFSAHSDIEAEISYIKSAGQTGPTDGCQFCSDDAVEENDGDVIEHLARISHKSNEIGELSLIASQQNGGTLHYYAEKACDLTRSTLNDIPAAKATVFWAPIGIAHPSSFDQTESKLRRVKSLLPNCF